MGSPKEPSEFVAAAYRIADEVLFPAATEVDRTGIIPATHWQSLADAGLFGIAAPADVGGLDFSLQQVVEMNEVLASGCLATTFTWVQHHGVVISLAKSTNSALRGQYLRHLMDGSLRAGVAHAGVIPTPARMTATRMTGGWRFDGFAPFVSGWPTGADNNGINLLQISARDTETDDVIAALLPLDAVPSSVGAAPLHLAAAEGTQTAALTIVGLELSDEQIVSRVSLDDFFANQRIGIRLNGIYPLGLIRRCTALLDAADHVAPARALRATADDIRTRLDASLADPPAPGFAPGTDPEDPLIAARADAAQLAVTAAATLVAASGGPALLRGSHAERLSREATFTLVAASRPTLKEELVRRLSGIG